MKAVKISVIVSRTNQNVRRYGKIFLKRLQTGNPAKAFADWRGTSQISSEGVNNVYTKVMAYNLL